MALVDGKQLLKVGADSTIFGASSRKSGPLVKLAPCKRLLSMNTSYLKGCIRTAIEEICAGRCRDAEASDYQGS
jgi:hypothetical protein